MAENGGRGTLNLNVFLWRAYLVQCTLEQVSVPPCLSFLDLSKQFLSAYISLSLCARQKEDATASTHNNRKIALTIFPT